MDSSSVVFVHPSRLFAEAVAGHLKAPFTLACITSEVDRVPFEALKGSKGTIFMIGGQTRQVTSKVIRSIRERIPSAIIVVIGGTTEPEPVLAALEAGANGYLRESMTPQTLIMALELALQDEIILPPEALVYLRGYLVSSAAEVAYASRAKPQETFGTDEPKLDPGSPSAVLAGGVSCPDGVEEPCLSQNAMNGAEPLSARELIILRGLVNGSPNKVIAKSLDITEATVKVHVRTVLRKIRATNRTQAAVWAVKNLAGSLTTH